MKWLHIPITDISAPDLRFEQAWSAHGTQLIADVRSGARVLVHCKGGLGRAGTVAALMLVDLGVSPDEAIHSVRAARSQHAIETREQELYIREWMSHRDQSVTWTWPMRPALTEWEG